MLRVENKINLYAPNRHVSSIFICSLGVGSQYIYTPVHIFNRIQGTADSSLSEEWIKCVSSSLSYTYIRMISVVLFCPLSHVLTPSAVLYVLGLILPLYPFVDALCLFTVM